MDLILIKIDNVDDSFYEKLFQFISESGCKYEVITESKDELRFHELKIILSKRQVWLNHNEIELTAKEFNILELLARNKGRVFSKEEIYNRIWGEDYIY